MSLFLYPLHKGTTPLQYLVFGKGFEYAIRQATMLVTWGVVLALDQIGRRVEIREKGVLADSSLLKWSHIDSYQWHDETLLLKLNRPRQLSFRKNMRVWVKPEQHPEVEHLLQQRLNDASTN